MTLKTESNWFYNEYILNSESFHLKWEANIILCNNKNEALANYLSIGTDFLLKDSTDRQIPKNQTVDHMNSIVNSVGFFFVWYVV